MLIRASLTTLVMVAACSTSSSSSSPDAATAGPPTVMAVTCPATPAASIMTMDDTNAFMPSTASVSVGQIVKFTMSSTHDVVPDTTMSDPGLTVDLNATKCLQFTHAGTFGFHCGIHGFTGMITVQ